MLTKLMFRLLPVQILLAAVSAVNGIVSSFFASNYVGVNAMSAVGLYSPLSMFINAVSTILVGGSVILCGKYMGENREDKMRNIFSLNLVLTVLISLLFVVIFVIMGFFDLTGFITGDPVIRPLFNRYLLGQSIGVLPLMLGNSFAAFLLLENKGRRTLVASLVYIGVNVILNFVFVQFLQMQELGLALASSLGMWVFLGIQAQYYMSGKSHLKFSAKKLDWGETKDVFKIGVPGALSFVYQTVRGLIDNALLGTYVGAVGISALATSDNLLRIFWAVPIAMLAVSRLLISVSIGEEDRQTLTDVMRVMFRRYIPLMCAICLAIIVCAYPLTYIFYQDPSSDAFIMTMWGFRIMTICMPLSIICMHFTCYAQASGKQFLVHILALLDGVVCVAGFTAILIPSVGMNSVYIANVLNGVVTTIVIILYSIIRKKSFPTNMEKLMVIDDDFGVPQEERMDLSLKSNLDISAVAANVQQFCKGRGIDERRSYLAGLAMEEMAGNIVDHGFTKDKKNHSVDVRVVHKGDNIILRIKDDCIPFDPAERLKITSGDDIMKNIGIRMVYKIASEVTYQNILGLNVLTIKI